MTPKRALSSPPAITGLLDSVFFFLPAFAPSIAVLFVSPSEQCQTLSPFQAPPLHIHNPGRFLLIPDSLYKFHGNGQIDYLPFPQSDYKTVAAYQTFWKRPDMRHKQNVIPLQSSPSAALLSSPGMTFRFLCSRLLEAPVLDCLKTLPPYVPYPSPLGRVPAYASGICPPVSLRFLLPFLISPCHFAWNGFHHLIHLTALLDFP